MVIAASKKQNNINLGNPISKTGFICSNCYEDIDEDSVFCKHCGVKLDG